LGEGGGEKNARRELSKSYWEKEAHSTKKKRGTQKLSRHPHLGGKRKEGVYLEKDNPMEGWKGYVRIIAQRRQDDRKERRAKQLKRACLKGPRRKKRRRTSRKGSLGGTTLESPLRFAYQKSSDCGKEYATSREGGARGKRKSRGRRQSINWAGVGSRSVLVHCGV